MVETFNKAMAQYPSTTFSLQDPRESIAISPPVEAHLATAGATANPSDPNRDSLPYITLPNIIKPFLPLLITPTLKCPRLKIFPPPSTLALKVYFI